MNPEDYKLSRDFQKSVFEDIKINTEKDFWNEVEKC